MTEQNQEAEGGQPEMMTGGLMDVPDFRAILRKAAREVLREMAADEPKRPWESRGVVFGVVAAAAVALNAWLSVDTATTTELLVEVGAAVSALIGVWGRWQATRPIRLRR